MLPAIPVSFSDERPAKVGQASIRYNPAREIFTNASGFIDGYDYTLNPYSGCSFGCSYCYAAFFAKDEFQDSWGYWVQVKDNAVDLLRGRPPGSLDGKRIYMSSVTDPYQPIEKELNLTRSLLELFAEYHKVKLVVQTRSTFVARDVDLFKKIEENGGDVQVNMTITTDDEDIRKTFEPSCPSNSYRMRAIKYVCGAGVRSCVTMTPLLLVDSPYAFTDSLLETGVEKFIVQPFHFKQGKFLAATRELAYDLMAEKLGCPRDNFQDEYLEHYRLVLDVLKDMLPSLGEGKDGFKPPF